ncbi:MAG: hypothetical protein ACREEM_56145, partial [Blastocatellia bacterium]
CFALLMFVKSLARARSEPISAHAESWRRYVTRWEEGFTREPRPCDESIAFLVTALGHSFFDLDESGQAPIIDPARFAEGACACLELISAAFAQGTSPDSVDFGKLQRLPSFARARGQIEQERSQYRLALQHGKVCQLGVPLAGSERAMVVDALFLEERNPSGLLKTFARNDRENTWNRARLRGDRPVPSAREGHRRGDDYFTRAGVGTELAGTLAGTGKARKRALGNRTAARPSTRDRELSKFPARAE